MGTSLVACSMFRDVSKRRFKVTYGRSRVGLRRRCVVPKAVGTQFSLASGSAYPVVYVGFSYA